MFGRPHLMLARAKRFNLSLIDESQLFGTIITIKYMKLVLEPDINTHMLYTLEHRN